MCVLNERTPAPDRLSERSAGARSRKKTALRGRVLGERHLGTSLPQIHRPPAVFLQGVQGRVLAEEPIDGASPHTHPFLAVWLQGVQGRVFAEKQLDVVSSHTHWLPAGNRGCLKGSQLVLRRKQHQFAVGLISINRDGRDEQNDAREK